MINIEETIKKMSLEEKAKLLSGYKNMDLISYSKYGIRSLKMSDGPTGIRMTRPDSDNLTGVSDSLPATAFPTGTVLASTFNPDIAYKYGKAIGKEGAYYGVDLLLGPSVNIKRNPLCGRNFEYYSEDPFLAGKIGISFVKGVQSENVGVTPKHFACNNNEKYRFTGNSVLDDRALNEIYLKPFEMIVKEAMPLGIMSSYNKINGINASENNYTQNELLRKKWGFCGVNVTDWGGIVHRDVALENGNDLEMPGQIEHNIDLLVKGVKDNKVKEETINNSVRRVLNLLNQTENKAKYDESIFEENYKLALEVGLEGTTLLKNDNDVLPLSKEEKILFVGELFEENKYQGSGSSLLNPYKLVSINEFLKSQTSLKYEYVKGYELLEDKVNLTLEKEAIEKAKNYEKIVYLVAQNDFVESEGFDRDSIKLADNQLHLLNELIKLNKKIIIANFNGSVIELPFKDKVDAILNFGMAGEAIGEIFYKILYGEVSPSGRLNETYIKTYEDVPFGESFTKTPNEIYKESIFVGYRYYDSFNIDINYPFGYGLSYSKFEYSDFNIKDDNFNKKINISLIVKNVGKMGAKDVVEVFVRKLNSNVLRPVKELKGFKKEEVKVNENKLIEIEIPYEVLKVYDINSKDFVLEDGEYEFIISKNSREEIFKEVISLKGEKILNKYSKALNEAYSLYENKKLNEEVISDQIFEEILTYKIPKYEFNKKPYTLETPIGEFDSFVGKIFKKATANVGIKKFEKSKKIEDKTFREREMKSGYFVAKMMPNNNIRSLSFSSSGQLKFKVALALVEFINGHYIKGIKILMRKEK